MSKLIESMKQEFSLFLHAFEYYSRIPVGQIDFCEENLRRHYATFLWWELLLVVWRRWFCLICFALRLPQSVAAVAALAAMILATGALHEDGFADFFDGFGGGYTKERILEIMKDSRSGAYGVMALILAFLLKFSLFVSISSSQLPGCWWRLTPQAGLPHFDDQKLAIRTRRKQQGGAYSTQA